MFHCRLLIQFPKQSSSGHPINRATKGGSVTVTYGLRGGSVTVVA